MVLKFRTACEGKGAKVFRNRNLIKDPWKIGVTYVKSFKFIIDVLAILPLPQILLWSSTSHIPIYATEIIAAQIVPRMLSMLPIDRKMIEDMGSTFKSPWSGAIYNLCVFILFGHEYITELWRCLHRISQLEMSSDSHVEHDCALLHNICLKKFERFEHGMFSDAFKNQIGVRSFVQKVIYCFVWGVRSLSSLGQTFDASYDTTETCFSCMVMILGLILLADLIARMQTTVQSSGARRERQRLKQRRLEEWTHYHHLPHDLKALVRQSVQLEWQSTRGIDDEGILNSLPLGLQRDNRTHLYKGRLCSMPPFTRMDEQLLDFICVHLRPFTGPEGTYIVLQGDPLDKVIFIFNGKLQLTHHSNGRANSRSLEAGDFFGDDLLTWASQPNPSNQDLPPSYYTVKCVSNVEAFCLHAEYVRLLVIFNYIQKFQLALRKHHA